MFGRDTDDADHDVFADRCKDDRHHFRFIVSPDDTHELGDLKCFARDLMVDMESDLGTKLDWVGVDHWNTEHPHIHILVRGVADDGENLVISRDVRRMHRSLADHGIDKGAAEYVLAAEQIDKPIIGRLLERGLDDELRGSAYAIVDGIDGHTHHIRFHNLDATADSEPGSIVELRRYEDAKGRSRVAPAVRSDPSIEEQIHAHGATWLDRLPFTKAADGDLVAGICRQRFSLASDRFAMIDDGFGFRLVPWSPSLETQIGKHISGIARAEGGVEWISAKKRALGL